MGENEQGGMLRTVVVIGIIAIIASIITLGVVGLKNNMVTQSDHAVGAISTKAIPFAVSDSGELDGKTYTPDSTWSGQGHWYRMPKFDTLPAHSWREVHIDLIAKTEMDVGYDVNVYLSPTDQDYRDNDYDKYSDRSFKVYTATGKAVSGNHLESGSQYVLVMKYHNTRDVPLYEGTYSNAMSALNISSKTGAATKATINSISVATYEDKYAVDSQY